MLEPEFIQLCPRGVALTVTWRDQCCRLASPIIVSLVVWPFKHYTGTLELDEQKRNCLLLDVLQGQA